MYKLFSVKDAKVGAFDKCFPMKTAGLAIRGFEQMINDHQNPTNLSLYPEDFTLYEIGEYDDNNGHLKNHSQNIELCTGISVCKNRPTQTSQISTEKETQKLTAREAAQHLVQPMEGIR